MGANCWVNFALVLSTAACLCLYIYARRGAASLPFTSYSPTVVNYPSPPPMAAQTASPPEPESNRSSTTPPPPETGFGPEPDRSRFRTIAVYCGSSPGRKASYQEAAVELGRELVERRIDLVYGGGSVGLMGLVAQAVHDGGRHVLGVIPKSLMPREICGETVGELRAVSDMHERKAEMARLADAFIALPGGYGTLEELLEVITWAQLGIHKKPVGLLNVDGFYNSLLSFVDMAVDEGFISKTARRIIVSAPSAKELVRMLEEYVPQFDDFVSKLTWEVKRPIAGPEMENEIA